MSLTESTATTTDDGSAAAATVTADAEHRIDTLLNSTTEVNDNYDNSGRQQLTSTTENHNHNNDDSNYCHESEILITLISNDQKKFRVLLDAVKLSGFIVDTLGLDDDDDNDDDDEEHQPSKQKNAFNSSKQLKQYEAILIPRVNGTILEKIIDFLLHYHQVNPMPPIQQPMIGDTFQENMNDVWYQQYILKNEEQDGDDDDNNDDDQGGHASSRRLNHSHNRRRGNDTIFHILEAANFMEIAPIIDLTCLWCTFQISGKSTEEIRVLLNLPKMTPEEEAQAREDHPWIFESITPS